jgi:predicted DNA-binding transcriptional regulator AlpA
MQSVLTQNRQRCNLDLLATYLVIITRMQYFTTQQAALKLGIGLSTLIRHIVNDKVPAPKSTKIGKRDVRAWTERDIERVRDLLPKIENGRKTRYRKKKQQSRKDKP